MQPQLNLWNASESNVALDIPGLQYIPDYITAAVEQSLIAQIDQMPWRSDLKRRVQHYGYIYDYKSRGLDYTSYLGPLPTWLAQICKKLKADQVFPAAPDQVIVNEYEPGQGISAHIDCVPCFKDTIASLSLASPCVMEFTQPITGEKKSVQLEARSLIILSGGARYEWQHSIPARKSDIINGIKNLRGRRISMTFRNVILNAA